MIYLQLVSRERWFVNEFGGVVVDGVCPTRPYLFYKSNLYWVY